MAKREIGVKEVAQNAGVAMSTVSRVLSNHPDVSDGSRKKVLAAVDSLGYRPNMIGQMLRQGATMTIGFVVSDISNPLFAQIALGAEVLLGEYNYSLIITNSMSDARRELKDLRALEQRRLDGLLLSVTTERDDALLEQLKRFGKPMVAIDRDIPPGPLVGRVLSDHRAAMTEAMEALSLAGHRTVALIAGLANLRPGRERIRAALDAAERFQMTCHIETVSTDESGIKGLRRIFALVDAPTAIIAGNNQLLADAIHVFNERKLSVGRDISLITCDDVPLLAAFRPRIATIRRDPY